MPDFRSSLVSLCMVVREYELYSNWLHPYSLILFQALQKERGDYQLTILNNHYLSVRIIMLYYIAMYPVIL